MGDFQLSLGVFYVRLRCGAVSVLDLYLVSFPMSARELVRLVCRVTLKCIVIVYILMLYSKLPLIGMTSFAGRTEM